MMKKILTYFIAWRVLITLFSILVIPLFSFRNNFVTDYEFRKDLPYLVWIWGNFDGFHYMSIAKNGYSHFQNAFFPLYPVLISFFKTAFEFHRIIAGLTISHVALLGALFTSYKLLLFDKQKKLLNLFFLTVILFPTSLFYGAVYNDSLFLFLATLTLYYGREKSYFTAGIYGALATLTRLNGLALFFFLIFEYISHNTPDEWNLKKLMKHRFSYKDLIQTRLYAALFIPLAFFSYLYHTQVKYGNWSLVFSSMKAWYQDKVTFPLVVFWRYIKIIFLHPSLSVTYWVALFELLFVFLYIALIIYSFKKIRLSYWVFFALSILIPALTGTFQGMPRYGLHLYPFFLSLTLFLSAQGKVARTLYFSVAMILLFLFVGFFTRGYFIA